MNNSDNIQVYKIGKQFFTMYAPPREDHYAIWESIGGLVCIIIISFMLWWCTP